jgi:uncharacterized protein YdeI (YjbR/CyaY-like superfamily)
LNPKVNWYFEKDTAWQNEYILLREIVLKHELEEVLKWGCPCYALENKNVLLIHGFKNYCAILFLNGVLINDTHQLLIQQTPNVQQARQLRFASIEDIKLKKGII